MDKKFLIAGGVGVAAVVIFVAVKARNKPDTEEVATGVQMMPDTGFFSGMAPISGGAYSDGGGAGGAGGSPTVPGNSGANDVGGGFDIASLFETMFKEQNATNRYQIQSGMYNYDSAVLASIVGSNGTAFVTHNADGTSITNTPGDDAYTSIVKNLYKEELGRAPELSGLTFWKNELMNKNLSVTQARQEIQNSPEYLKLVQAAPKPVSDFKTQYSQSSTTNTQTGVTTSTQSKVSA